MLVVLLIISILILVTIPNVTKYSAMIDKKGCEAYLQMVQGQMETYKIENQKYPTIEQLRHKDYLNVSAITCPNGNDVEIIDDQAVEKKASNG